MNENENDKLYHYEIYVIKISFHCRLSILLYILAAEMGRHVQTNGSNEKQMNKIMEIKKTIKKTEQNCIFRIYATLNSSDGTVNVVYISAHTNHSLAIEDEANNIPLP